GAGGAARAGREPPAGAAAAEPRADARQRGGVGSSAVPGRSVARDGGAGRRERRLRFDSAPPSRVPRSAAARVGRSRIRVQQRRIEAETVPPLPCTAVSGHAPSAGAAWGGRTE